MPASLRSTKIQTALPRQGGFSIGLTGGIASGKSTVSKEILENFDIDHCDADVIVHELLKSDLLTRKEVLSHFGDDILDASQNINRAALGKIVFASDEKRRILEGILHPKVRMEWMRLLGAAKERSRSILVEIPLLFETRAETQLDTIVLVACSAETQLQRMIDRRGLSTERAKAILAAQMKTSEKIAKANHVIWNDGSLSCMSLQVQHLFSNLFLKN
ncbi:MAG: dephospho-CoA kinase [Chthoniobacterales bacterium]